MCVSCRCSFRATGAEWCGSVRYGTVRCRMAHIVYVALTSMGVECCGPMRHSPTLRNAHCARRVGVNGCGMMRVGTVRFAAVNAHCVLGDGAICFGTAYLAWAGWDGRFDAFRGLRAFCDLAGCSALWMAVGAFGGHSVARTWGASARGASEAAGRRAALPAAACGRCSLISCSGFRGLQTPISITWGIRGAIARVSGAEYRHSYSRSSGKDASPSADGCLQVLESATYKPYSAVRDHAVWGEPA